MDWGRIFAVFVMLAVGLVIAPSACSNRDVIPAAETALER